MGQAGTFGTENIHISLETELQIWPKNRTMKHLCVCVCMCVCVCVCVYGQAMVLRVSLF